MEESITTTNDKQLGNDALLKIKNNNERSSPNCENSKIKCCGGFTGKSCNCFNGDVCCTMGIDGPPFACSKGESCCLYSGCCPASTTCRDNRHCIPIGELYCGEFECDAILRFYHFMFWILLLLLITMTAVIYLCRTRCNNHTMVIFLLKMREDFISELNSQ